MRLGIKSHWRDVEQMAAIADKHGARVLEYQMLPGDLEQHRDAAFEAFLPYRERFELRVHQPECFLDGDGQLQFLDIASPDPETRAESTRVLGEVARHAMELRAKSLIIHPGGIWRGNVGGGWELLRDSLEDLPRHVKILLENMPEVYALRSMGLPDGESPAAFRMPQGLARVDDLVDGFVLDISHAYLCVAQGSLAMPELFARELGPRIRHVHAAGSRGGMGSAGEGTPFSDSDYGADFVRDVLAALPSDVVVVPEIMDGHKDDGLLFDEGMAFLRGLDMPS